MAVDAKRLKVKFYGGVHGIEERLVMLMDPASIHWIGQGIDWNLVTIWQMRKLRKHMCPLYTENRLLKCDCQDSWEWESGY